MMDINASTSVWTLMGLGLVMVALVYFIGYQAGRGASEKEQDLQAALDAKDGDYVRLEDLEAELKTPQRP